MDDLIEHQYLTFTLDGEQYAIPVARVREVLEYTRITKLPKTAEYMKGIINLRGAGIPVIDLRLKFGLSETPVEKDTAIIVMEVAGLEGNVVVGALADAVHEVIELLGDAVEPAPKFGTRLAADFIQGVGKRDEGFIVIVDIDRVFNAEDKSLLAGARQETMQEA
jgi:purine-binding chemotaxis protein CheW